MAGISAAEYLGALRQVQLEQSLDQQCRQQYGNSAEFDGVDACRCKEGFINDNGRCVADQYGIGHQQKLTAGYMESGSVVELSDSTFLQMLQEGGMWVVMFSAPWCTHCTQSKPHFAQAAVEYAQVKHILSLFLSFVLSHFHSLSIDRSLALYLFIALSFSHAHTHALSFSHARTHVTHSPVH